MVVMIVVVMMVVMVMVSASGVSFDMAVLLMAMLADCLEFKCGVTNTVLMQLLADLLFNFVRVCTGHDMHGGVIALSVHAPDVDMVDICNAVNVHDVLSDFGNTNAVRRFLKEQIQRLFEVIHSIYQNKDRHTDRHNRVNECKICKAHYNCADKHHCPAEHIFEHVQIDRFLIE